MRKYYKIVKRNYCHLGLQSITDFGIVIDGKCLFVDYKVGEWTYPRVPRTGLFVFDSIDSIKSFVQIYPGYRSSYHEIYEVKIGNKLKTRFRKACFISRLSILEMINKAKNKKRILSDVPPQGTVCTNKVMLVKKICRADEL